MVLVDNTLVSVSSDSTIRLWNPFSIDELDETDSSCVKCINENKGKLSCLASKLKIFKNINLNLTEEGTPTSVDFISNDKSKIITSFGASHHNVYDLETSKVTCRLDYSDTSQSKPFLMFFFVEKKNKSLNIYFLRFSLL